MNARMYAVTPAVEAGWQALLGHIANAAGLSLRYLPYPAPQPLENLWSRPDVGCVFMCGFSDRLRLAALTPIAAPIPRPSGRGRSLLSLRPDRARDAPYRTLEDTFGARADGRWNIPTPASMPSATISRVPDARTAAAVRRGIRQSGDGAQPCSTGVRQGRIDVGPLDAYWHLLIARPTAGTDGGIAF